MKKRIYTTQSFLVKIAKSNQYCDLFYKAFAGVSNIHDVVACGGWYDKRHAQSIGGKFYGVASVNHRCFIAVRETEEGRFKVYVDNPLVDGKRSSDQWIFSYHRSLNRAIAKAKAIALAGKYPTPIEIYK